ncbi:hypothetical protein NLG97_g6970 [Lecanicillium saksenae]|uniref:Uncharacterized protein n=1 Tax=Lecanicillium saksenae TaxID=468837 RepID=A0ACC1QQH2_9HYPO|nr:hypothetical protein NLG97_g6970 [Lecanicillium saksenae]
MKTVIAESSLASINLLNALQSINREKERISDNQTAVQRFEICKQLRRRVLRYIHHVEHEQWLGGLLHANDELVHALMTYEQLDQSIDADSDSDDEIAEQAHLYRMVAAQKGKDTATHETPAVDKLNLNEPVPAAARVPSPPRTAPRPPASSAPPQHRQPPAVAPGDDLESASEDEGYDDDDPFADSNVVIGTPAVERHEPRW